MIFRFLFLMLLLCLAGCGNSGSRAVKKALKALNNEHYQEAEEKIRRVLDLYPKHPDKAYLYNLLGVVYWHQREIQEANDAFQKSRELDSQLYEPVYNLGALFLKQGDLFQAEKLMKVAADLNQNNTEPYQLLASEYLHDEQWDKAHEALLKALDRNPNSPDIFTRLAIAGLHVKGPSYAESYLKEALKKDPAYPPAVFNMGVIYKDYHHKSEEADRFFNRYLNIESDEQRRALVKATLFPSNKKIIRSNPEPKEKPVKSAGVSEVKPKTSPVKSPDVSKPEQKPRIQKPTVVSKPKPKPKSKANVSRYVVAKKDHDTSLAQPSKISKSIPKVTTAKPRVVSKIKTPSAKPAVVSKPVRKSTSLKPAFVSKPASTKKITTPQSKSAIKKQQVAKIPPPKKELTKDQEINKLLAEAKKASRVGAPGKALHYCLQAAQEAKRAKDYEQELKALKMGVAVCSNQARSHFALGRYYLEHKKYSESTRCFKKATQLRPDWPDAQRNLAQAAMENNEYLVTLSAMKNLIELEPSNPDALWVLGVFYDDLLEFDERAVNTFETFNNTFPQDARSTDAKKRIAQIKSVKSIKPPFSKKRKPTHTLLSTSTISTKNIGKNFVTKPTEGQSQRDKALESFRKGFQYHQEKEYDKAILLYQHALQFNPAYERAHYNLGLIYHKRQEFSPAIASYRKSLEINPKFFDARYNLSLIYMSQKQYGKAQEELNRILQMDSSYESARNMLNKIPN